MNRLLIAACVGLVASACAPASTISSADQARAPAATRTCFLPQTVNNFRAEDETTLYVRAGRNQVFEIRTSPCFGLDNALSLAFVQPVGSGASACVGDSVDLVVRGPAAASVSSAPCRAEVVRPLSETEVAALPARLRP